MEETHVDRLSKERKEREKARPDCHGRREYMRSLSAATKEAQSLTGKYGDLDSTPSQELDKLDQLTEKTYNALTKIKRFDQQKLR